MTTLSRIKVAHEKNPKNMIDHGDNTFNFIPVNNAILKTFKAWLVKTHWL
jgi:hypothetical protein